MNDNTLNQDEPLQQEDIIKRIRIHMGEDMLRLYEHWDEIGYEDFSYYEKSMKYHAEQIKGVMFVKSIEFPFGFIFEYQSKKYKFIVEGNRQDLELSTLPFLSKKSIQHL